MGFKCGIVGVPNVGKSTLFNALTETAAAQAANYPFCTIEPNVGEVAVPDPRLDTLAKLAKSAEIVPTRLTFVDIAGLVKGASKGEGLGNQFLGNIREVDAIAHVVRCFDDPDVTHVSAAIDPVADIETIETELMLADLDSLERRVDALEKRIRGQDKEAKETLDLVNRSLALLREGKPARRPEAQPGAARRRAGEAQPRPGQGGEGDARPGQPVPRAAARGQARAPYRAQARGGKAVPLARPAHLDAGALRLQRRGGRSRDRQRLFARGGKARRARRRGLGGHLGQERGRDRRAAARGARAFS